MSLPVTSKVPYGGDYNPEQWPEEVWRRRYGHLRDFERILGRLAADGVRWYMATDA